MPTPEQQALIDAIFGLLESEPRIQAAWLSGSLGKGGGDEFSDVDVLALVEGAPPAEVSADVARNVGEIAKPVLVNSLYGGVIVNVVTEEWRRFDIVFIGPDFLPRYDSAALTLLFNRGALAPPRREPAPYRPSPDRVLQIVKEFIRVLGLTPVIVGREEYVMALSGTDLLRKGVMDLMVEANGIHPADRGGALHLNRLLTPEQIGVLAALPPVAPERQSVIDSGVALARVFLPLARQLAAEVGAEWPEAFEAATRRHLERTIGVSI